MTNFQNKALSSYFWSLFESLSNQGIQFIIGVFLARLLFPEDFGTIGVLSIFIAVSGVLVDGGFKISIIRSNSTTKTDYSTIFYINLFVSFLVGGIFFFASSLIAEYLQKPELSDVSKVFAFIPIINGFGLVQSAIILKNLEFKKNAKISFVANLFSGLAALVLAYKGYSYWALVWRAFLTSLFYTIIIWLFSTWRPKFVFSLLVLKKHFNFSSKILLTGLLDSFFDNLYSLIFGKLYSFKDLGFYSRGKAYAELASNSISMALQKVNTPLLSSEDVSNDNILSSYSKLLQSSCFLVMGINVLMITIAEPFILLLLGPKWLPAAPYLQISCLIGIIYNILNSNSSLLEVLGRSDYILLTTLISRPIQIAILCITTQISMHTVIYGVFFHYIFILFISIAFVVKATNRKFSFFIKPLYKPILFSIISGTATILLNQLIKNYFSSLITLSILVTFLIICTYTLLRIFNLKEYQIIKVFQLRLIQYFK